MDFAALAAAVPLLEAAGVLFGLLYLVLAVRESIWCWLAAFVSSVLSVIVLFDARLYSESALSVFYAAMAVYGWYQWLGGRRRGVRSPELPISTWSARAHLRALAAILAATAAIGWLMTNTSAAFPYLDALVTAGSIVTTYMVAKKILENWLYWILFDGLALYLYVARELYWYAGLFVLYLVLVVVGFRRWRREWRAQPALVA
jgi:nicotinamide mononucleotide transporter